MTRLLASVTDPDEARLAAAGGADIVDIKNPAEGALGALPAATIREIRAILPKATLSATIGDLPPQPGPVLEAVRSTAACGVDYVKIGFFPGGDLDATLKALRPLTADCRLIAVLLADYLIALPLLDILAEYGFAGAMLDTADKAKGPLTAIRPRPFLERFVNQARERGLLTGLAGSLQLEDIDQLLPLRPDYLGFRGALCRKGRQSRLDPRRLQAIREKIPG
ncbi:(5-formylfuran-3-yl)methyl phosphate synthase [Methylomarinovum tepidoasis]|uniref:(5-formylfuran-3-yl)methyl phosphate synthase n=1 Tax=Methylomarinovum tepidoasis TaxID=2840183 RepID=A0AAU9CHS8_9GAMM|nr:(5-formylfuran-3-yl)methyl phosphate synthase [Methylomarinovum sp. IN45]BCX88911.1 (5-formylfuran-3-yl)methyl phosphate synthase [Methylomarinovum sp. IN45]